MKIKLLLKSGILASASLIVAAFSIMPIAQAQSTTQIYLSPASGTYASGQTFTIELKVNAQTEINAIVAKITYPTDKLDLTNVSYTNSAFSIQAISTENNGSIDIQRGVIVPFKGDRLVATLSFKALSNSGTAVINLANGSLVVNNGKEVPSSNSGAKYSFSGVAVAPTNTSNNSGNQNKSSNAPADINAGNAGATTKIIVVRSNNKPINGASVSINGETKTTNKKGEVIFDLSLGQNTSTIKFGDKTIQDTFVLGMATTADSPTIIKTVMDVKAPRVYTPATASIVMLLFVLVIVFLVIRRFRSFKTVKQPDLTLDEQTIVPTATTIARQSLNDAPVNSLANDEPIDKLQQPPKLS